MNRIARFEKVSKEKFFEGWKDTFETAEEKEMEAIYESLKLPGRATAGSAGYDFFCTGEDHTETGRNRQDSNGSPCVDGTGLGTEVLSEKRTGIQVQTAAE